MRALNQLRQLGVSNLGSCCRASLNQRIFFHHFQGLAFLLVLAVLACAEDEKKPVEDSKVEETQAEDQADKKQEKRGIHDFGDHGWSSHDQGHHAHEEKTLTIVKKIPVAVPHYKTVHVPHIKEVHVPYHVKVNKPYPVIKHVSIHTFR